jgi:hypothetical protein
VALFGLADVGELRDPFGPALIEEAGLLHVVVWYALILLAVAIPTVAAIRGRRRKSSQPDSWLANAANRKRE